MNEKLLIKKIQALLHDPPEKAIILRRLGHEDRALEIMKKFIPEGEAQIPDEVKNADHIASAADRINFPTNENYIADFCNYPIIKHPLSAKEFNLKELNIRVENITSSVDRAIESLIDKYHSSQEHNGLERLYLSLWRELIHSLMDGQNDTAHLGQLWELLPADTRVPDHSIWEHKRITSAIAGALPEPAFLLFAIGPVQEFIATARKTQDLWVGSYLLSYLSWTAMRVVAEEFGPDSLIFPDLCGQPFADRWLIDEKGLTLNDPLEDELSSPTLPNRFFAIVPEESVESIASKAKEEVRNRFISICNSIKNELEKRIGITPNEWESLWDRQINDFIETYWAALPVTDYSKFLDIYKELMGIKGNWEFDELLRQYKERGFEPNIGTLYGMVYRLTEKALGSRKSLRDFRQTDEPNYKCTLCGVREPVHPGSYNGNNCSEDFGALRGFWQEKVMAEFPQIRRSERLCAVCLTKRLSSNFYFKEVLHFNIKDSFPSVSMVATAAFKLRVIENFSQNDLLVSVKNYVEIIKHIAGDRWCGTPIPMVIKACRDDISKEFARLEGDWLYEEAFDNEDALLEENKSIGSSDLKKLIMEAKKRQKSLFEVIDKIDRDKEDAKKIGRPSTYYAVLLMDGDNMGRWLSGESAPNIDDVLHPTVKNNLIEDNHWQSLLKQKRPLNPSLHLATSKALRDFSLKVAREIVEKDHLGKLVYAGGDDVLAFVNLRDLADVMRKLRAYFSGSLISNRETNKVDIDFGEGGTGFVPVDGDGDPININSQKPIKGFILSMGTNATASMGVVIAHHSSNLSQVLDEVRKCEKEAKKLKEKNAFCIALDKRSGGTEYVKARWYYSLGSKSIFESIPLLQQWADSFYNDYISPRFVYSFRTETKGLEELPEEGIKLELIRIATRHRDKKRGNLSENNLNDLLEGLVILHRNGHSLEEIGAFLSLCAFLGREENR